MCVIFGLLYDTIMTLNVKVPCYIANQIYKMYRKLLRLTKQTDWKVRLKKRK